MALPSASSVDRSGRGFRTDFESHKNLLHKFARMVLGRLRAAGVPAEYEDIFGDMCESYSRALLTYNPDRGVTFTAYLGRAVWNNVNRVVDATIREHHALGLFPLSQFVEEEGQTEETVHNLLSAGVDLPSPEENVIRNEQMAHRVLGLPPLARRVIKELVSPSEGLRQTHAAMKAHREHAKELGRRSRLVPDEITLPVIFQHLGLSQEQIDTVHEQCMEHLGVDIFAST